MTHKRVKIPINIISFRNWAFIQIRVYLRIIYFNGTLKNFHEKRNVEKCQKPEKRKACGHLVANGCISRTVICARSSKGTESLSSVRDSVSLIRG